ncbi:pseudaminic acid biosynthesis-associated methylase [Hyphobacterium sp. HN65]|uniref:Pseudaminic acid biosynthesis-associated methylase n=1 Tax=Hyphobacterium lacteum TaxID=3116575 RepID=A0ABU7LQM8_9PROT|nr:pseudaminic acid biosynthesis-associated methylase [Hyphobacterium sp. HN65]MEE2526203.1 pseudaminic acid biosynthesis-associated methylase [Hyphobacterium sp. HN65]
MSYKTEQEAFWAGQFGDEYRERCSLEPELVAARTTCMAHMLRKAAPVGSAFEIGCNIGLNLMALNRVSPAIEIEAIEINAESARLANELGVAKVENASVLEYLPQRTYDLTMICGVLIHLNPEVLPQVYDVLFSASNRHILLFEYYNPTPVEVNYRGHEGRLFKRDWAGEMLDRFNGKLELKDYGFFYHRDPIARSDDGTWFLLEKR